MMKDEVTGIEYHRDLKEVQSDPRLGMVLDGAAKAPFDRIAWFAGLEAHCALDPLVAVMRDGADIAALPLRGDGRHLHAMANWYTFRFRPLLAGPAPERLLVPMARALKARTARITLDAVPDEDASASRLETAFRDAGWLVRRTASDVNHVLDTRGTDYDRYLAGRPGRLRTTLKRKTGKVEVRLLNHFDPDLWKAYEGIYAQSWKPAEGSPAFLRAFAAEEGASARLRFGIAFLNDNPVAAQMWTVEGDTAFIHKLAHLESARAASPGSVLTAALMAQVIDVDRVACVDFGTGDNPYKRDWMDAVRPRYRLDMIRPGHPANWPAMARALARKAIRRACPPGEARLEPEI